MAISNWRIRTPKLSEPRSVPSGQRRLSFGKFSVPVPESRPLRIGLGIALCLGGVLWFLPILGLWMLPLGLLVLSVDIPAIRRFRRRVEIWWGRRKKKRGPE